MDAPDLKLEFQKQLKDAEAKIVEAEKNLKSLNEYKIKLLGGLTESDLKINQVGSDARIKYGDDLMAIVENTLVADLTII